MAQYTKDALFIYRITNGENISTVETTRPVPLFLCTPSPSQRESQQWFQAYIDVLSLVNAEHQEQIMSKITTACVSCSEPATDCLKAPQSLLHLEEPLMMIQVIQICGNKTCELQAKNQMQKGIKEMQNKGDEQGKSIYLSMNCEICRKEDSKRCAGCGNVAYCGKECQRVAWKKHKRYCRRKNIEEEIVADPEEYAFDSI